MNAFRTKAFHREPVAAHQPHQHPSRRLIKHARYDWQVLAEGGLARRVFGALVRRMAALPVVAA